MSPRTGLDQRNWHNSHRDTCLPCQCSALACLWWGSASHILSLARQRA